MNQRTIASEAAQIDLEAVATLLGISNTTAFKIGFVDGLEQGFELSYGVSYEDLSSQWAYDLGTRIGAAFGVKGSLKSEDSETNICSTLNVSVTMGVATLPDATQINLCDVQRTCSNAFRQTGLAEYAIASDSLSRLTGLVQAGREEWLRVSI